MPDTVILGAGFIGSNLARILDGNCRLVDSSECDLTNLEQIQRTLQGCNHNTSLVVAAGVTRLRDNSYWGFCQNVLMAKNLASFLKFRLIRSVVFLSTVDVYGFVGNQTIDESFPVNPVDWYTISKVVSEFALAKGCNVYDIPLAVLRLSGVYGPRDGGKSVVGKLIQSAIERGIITVYGDGLDRRDFLFVQDVVQVICCELARPNSHIVNVATGTCHTILEIAQYIARRIPCKIEMVAHHPARARALCFDTTKLRSDLPEFVPTDIIDGIQHYLEHLGRKSG